jgi:hypothetical protein
MFSHLELNADELDDVVIGTEKATEFKKEARWLAIAKVITTRSFSAEALFEKMRIVWNLSRDPICQAAGENLFIFQMHCLGDWKKVVHQGPWTFRGWGVLINDYDGLEDPEKFIFSGMHVWAQIHGIPELYRKPDVVDDLSRKIGKVKEVQMSPKLFFEGNYVRIRVMMDIAKPLMRFVSLTTPEGKKRLQVKYEKVLFFCKRCGLIGHDHEECGDGVWEEKQLQFGAWMLAVRRANQPDPPPRRFVQRELSRGGWSGGGERRPSLGRKRSSEEAGMEEENDLKDTASSPIKPGQRTEDMEEDSEETRRRLQFEGVLVGVSSGPDGNAPESEPPAPPLPPQYVKDKDRTKLRKKDATVVGNSLAPLAASLEEDRQAQ